MPAVAFDVTSYVVFAYGGPDGNAGAAATISLGVGPYASVFLRFYPNGTTLPATTISIATGSNPIYYVAYHYEQLPVIIDLLRNEKPIRFVYSSTHNSAYVTTSDEPVGEGES